MSLQRTYRSKVDGKIALVTGLAVVALVVAGVTLPDRNHDTVGS
jgi:hypothetical protein